MSDLSRGLNLSEWITYIKLWLSWTQFRTRSCGNMQEGVGTDRGVETLLNS